MGDMQGAEGHTRACRQLEWGQLTCSRMQLKPAQENKGLCCTGLYASLVPPHRGLLKPALVLCHFISKLLWSHLL